MSTAQQIPEQGFQTLGQAASAVNNMSREVSSNFGPLMAALYNAYSQFNKLNLTLAFSSAMASLGGAVIGGLGQLGNAAIEGSNVKDAYDTNTSLENLKTEFYGDYDPKTGNTGKITDIDNQLKGANSATVVGQEKANQSAQDIANSSAQAPDVNKSSLENDRDRYTKDYENQHEAIQRTSDRQAQKKQAYGQLAGVAGQIGKAAGDGAASILNSDSRIVDSTASQMMQVLSSMLQTINAILNNNPNAAFVGFARG